MRPTATDQATASQKCIDSRSQFATENESRGDNSRPVGKSDYGYAIMHTPPQIIGRWANNPDAPRLTDRHRSFLHYLWSSGGQARRVDEYAIEVEVDPRFGSGRDEYAAQIGVHPSTVSRWAKDLKAHGLLMQRKTRRRDNNPVGEGRTVWIVRVPAHAVEDRAAADRKRYADIRERREQIRAARDSDEIEPVAPRPKDYRRVRAGLVGHSVQEPASRPCEVLSKSHPCEVPSTSHPCEVPPTSHQREVDIRRTSESETSELEPSESKPHAAEFATQDSDLGGVAVRVLKDRIGLDSKMAHAFVNAHGGRAMLLFAHCFLVGKRDGGAGLFVNMVRDHEGDPTSKRHAFQHSVGDGAQMRPTADGQHLEVLFASGTRSIRKQTDADFQRLASSSGLLRTEPQPEITQASERRQRSPHRDEAERIKSAGLAFDDTPIEWVPF